MRGIYWDQSRADGGAVGLGGFATVNIPDVPGLSFTGGLHYAPSILSFGDSDDMTSLSCVVAIGLSATPRFSPAIAI